MAFKFKKGEKVIITTGKDKGKSGLISRSLPKENKVVVSGMNMVSRHMKPNKLYPEGGVVQFEKPLDASNVMHADPRTGKPTKIRFEIKGDQKVKTSKTSNEPISVEV